MSLRLLVLLCLWEIMDVCSFIEAWLKWRANCSCRACIKYWENCSSSVWVWVFDLTMWVNSVCCYFGASEGYFVFSLFYFYGWLFHNSRFFCDIGYGNCFYILRDVSLLIWVALWVVVLEICAWVVGFSIFDDCRNKGRFSGDIFEDSVRERVGYCAIVSFRSSENKFDMILFIYFLLLQLDLLLLGL